MAEWFNALTLDLQIFYGLGCLATLLLVIQLIMTVLGLGEDVPGDAATVDDGMLDVGGDMEHGDGLSLVSTRTIVAFLAGFGWTGAIALNSGLGLPAAVVVALVVGFVLMLMVFWLMRGLYSLRQSGSLDYQNAVGQSGTVYIKIPAAGGGTGQIQVLVQGRLATVAAQTASPEEIPSGQQVKVTKVLAGNTLQVETI